MKIILNMMTVHLVKLNKNQTIILIIIKLEKIKAIKIKFNLIKY